MTSTAVN